MKVDRVEVSRALAKAIAYSEAGKPAEADEWARALIRALGRAAILRGNKFDDPGSDRGDEWDRWDDKARRRAIANQDDEPGAVRVSLTPAGMAALLDGEREDLAGAVN